MPTCVFKKLYSPQKLYYVENAEYSWTTEVEEVPSLEVTSAEGYMLEQT